MTEQNAIQLQNLDSEQLVALSEYTDPANLLEKLTVHDWTPDSEIRELIGLIQQDDNLSVKLKALKYLRELVREAMEAAGLRAHVTRTQTTPDGEVLTLSADLVASSLAGTHKELNRNSEQPDEVSGKLEGEPKNGETNNEKSRQRPAKSDYAERSKRAGKSSSEGDKQGDGGGRLHRPPDSTSRAYFPGISTPKDIPASAEGGKKENHGAGD